ncbi:MAG: NAD-dependent epimerase/dehydratase family protein [Solirubrobacteraceae bacterium]
MSRPTETDDPPLHARVLVTGCAGFIGSHLTEYLLSRGIAVRGVDAFTVFYARETKKRNVNAVRDHPAFELHRVDLSRDPLDTLLNGIDAVYHLAGQPGVRPSFGAGFSKYVRHNVEATQRLLEECVDRPIQAFVYASSSSVYGERPSFPTSEDAPREPVSPYGMTKKATEDLAGVYFRTHGIPVVGLRYFTVYGPRQRPDMAFNRFIGQLIAGHPVTVYGDGRQQRDFTYVDDVVRATTIAARRGSPGEVYNIGGGRQVVLLEALNLLGEILERPVKIQYLPAAPGDVRATGADGTRARKILGFAPETSLHDGLIAQVAAVQREEPRRRRRIQRAFAVADPDAQGTRAHGT